MEDFDALITYFAEQKRIRLSLAQDGRGQPYTMNMNFCLTGEY
jgi:hypothetical protein